MTKKILMEGMSCNHCVMHVTNALKELGLWEVKVDLGSKTAVVGGDVSHEAIKAAVEDEVMK